MELPTGEKSFSVFYDGHCGMCCSFQEWLNRQPQLLPLTFYPYQSPAAESAFPGITRLDPDREMIVREDSTGTLYRGGEAWVICLYSLTEFRGWARRLSTPTLLPLAKKTCTHIAANRRRLSKVFFHRKDADVATALHRMPPRPAACISDTCAV